MESVTDQLLISIDQKKITPGYATATLGPMHRIENDLDSASWHGNSTGFSLGPIMVLDYFNLNREEGAGRD